MENWARGSRAHRAERKALRRFANVRQVRYEVEILEQRIFLSGGLIFVTNPNGGTVGEYTTNGTTMNATLVSGLNLPYGIGVSGSNVYIAQSTQGTIGQYTTSGATVNASLISDPNFPVSIAVSGSDLYFANQANGTIGEYTTSGTTVNASLVSLGLGQQEIYVAVSGSDLFISNTDTGTIGEYNATTGAVVNASLISGLNEVFSIAVSGPDIFVESSGGNEGAGTIGEYDATTGTPVNATLVSGLDSPTGIAVMGNDLFVTNVDSGTIGEYDTSGNIVNAALVSGLSEPYGISVEPIGPPAQLAFGSLPSSITAGSPISPAITVGVEDANGNLVTSDNSSVTLSGATFGGTTTVTAVGGVATFSDLTFVNAGTYTLNASDAALSPGNSAPINVAASNPTGLIFVANSGSQTIGEYTTSGVTVNASLLSGVGADAVAVSGSDLFVSSLNSIGEYTTSGATVNASLITGLNAPVSIAISGSDLFVANKDAGTVGEYTTSGATVNASLISGLDTPRALAASGSDLFVGYGNLAVSSTIGEYTTSGATVNASLIPGLSLSQNSIALIGSDLFVSNDGLGTFGEYTTAGTTINASLGSGLSGGTVAVFGSDLFTITGPAFTQTIAEYTTSGTAVNTSLVSGLSAVPDIVIEPGSGGTSPAAPIETIGALDPTFGSNGFASQAVGFVSTAGVVEQSDGASIIVGTSGVAPDQQFGVTRYNSDGSLDTTFGTNGVTNSSFGGSDQASAVALLPDGDILVAGTDTTSSGSQFALAEYTPAGVLDTTFGNGNGFVLTSFSATPGTLSNDAAHALVVAPGGTIYVGGSSDAAGKGLDFAVASYNPDGSANTHFNGTGAALLDFSGGDDSINALALQTNGDLVAAGSTEDPATGITSIALARFLPTGAVDVHFGAKGKVTTNVRGVADIASSVALDKTGKIVIGGLSATGSAADGSLSSDFLVARYTAAGALDRTFGGGPVITSFGQPSAVTQVLIQADGNIVASGKTIASLSGLDPAQLDVALARYTTAGKLDTTFNTTGMAIISLSGTSAAPQAAEAARPGDNVQPDAISTAGVASLELASFTVPLSLSAQDTGSTLLAEFQQFEQSSQGAIAKTTGGELLDVGNSGANTVEAAIITTGVDLAAALIAKLPMAALEGARESLSVKITEDGANPATGTVTIQLYASPDGQVDAGLTPFQSFPERVSLKKNQSRTFVLHYALPTTAGTFNVVANVDSGSLHELNENNNAMASNSQVTDAAAYVNLAGNNLESVGAIALGKLATITFTVTNDGNILAKSAPVEILASVDGSTADGTPLATPKLVLNLPPNITRHYHLSFRMPTTLAANTYMLVAVLDPSLSNSVMVGQTQFTVA